jgi:hypothetical protein
MWRNCIASVTLGQEINGVWKSRDHASDGTIGDAAHASRESDHNPWVKDRNGVGVVRARDIDEDLDGKPANGEYDAKALFDKLLVLAKAGDPRLNGGGYLIYEGHIYSEKQNWAARKYTGPNAHKHHIHVSFSRNAAGYDSDASWGLRPTSAPKSKPIKLGDKGNAVAFITDLGNILAKAGYAINAVGVPSPVQVRVPTDKAGRAAFFFDNTVRARVAECQRFFRAMWKLAGSHGPEPLVNGIADDATLARYAFWVPIALQKKH